MKKSTRAAKARRTRTTSRHEPSSYAGSIADRLERSPGGIKGALARLNDAKASGRPMTALEKLAIATGEELPTTRPQFDNPTTWPVVWRVVAPAAGSYDQDMTFLETEDEAEARGCLDSVRESGFPVRLERVQCGPLPERSQAGLLHLRAVNPQNPGAEMRDVLGYWEAQA